MAFLYEKCSRVSTRTAAEISGDDEDEEVIVEEERRKKGLALEPKYYMRLRVGNTIETKCW